MHVNWMVDFFCISLLLFTCLLGYVFCEANYLNEVNQHKLEFTARELEILLSICSFPKNLFENERDRRRSIHFSERSVEIMGTQMN